jgi:hypothetical protein
MTQTTVNQPADELPEGDTVRGFRIMIARHASQAQDEFGRLLDAATQAAGRPPVIADPHPTDPATDPVRLAHWATLYGWSVASLIHWIEERYGAEAAYDAAALVQDMAVNGGADYCDDIMAEVRPETIERQGTVTP